MATPHIPLESPVNSQARYSLIYRLEPGSKPGSSFIISPRRQLIEHQGLFHLRIIKPLINELPVISDYSAIRKIP